MSVFSQTTLSKFCSNEWVAKAYSEYLLDCASATFSFVSAAASSGLNEELENAIAAASEVLSDAKTTIGAATREAMISQGAPSVNYDDPTTERFKQECLALIVAAPSGSPIANALEAIRSSNSQWRTDHPNLTPADYYDLLFNPNTNYDSYIFSADAVIAEITTTRNQLIANTGLGNASLLPLTRGFADITAAVDSLIKYFAGSSVDDIANVTLRDATGALIPRAEWYASCDELVEDLKASGASCIAWAQGFSSVGKANIADAIAAFDANVHTVITDTSARFSQAVNQVRATLVQTKAQVNAFFANAYEQLGWKQVHDSLYTRDNNTAFFDYTGASPLGAVNMKSATSVIAAVGRTIAQVGLGIMEAAIQIIKKAITAARPYIKALTNDPEDFKLVDKDDMSYTVDNYKMQFNDRIILEGRLTSAFDEASWRAFSTWANEHMTQQWYAIETLFFELCFRIRYVVATTKTYPDDSNTYARVILDQCEVQFRPRSVNYATLLEYGIAYKQYQGTAAEVISFMPDGFDIDTYLGLLTRPEFRPSDDATEEQLFMGFIASLAMGEGVLRDAHHTMRSEARSGLGFSFEFIKLIGHAPYDEFHYFANAEYPSYVVGRGREYPVSVNNLDCISATCGYSAAHPKDGLNNFFWLKQAYWPQGTSGAADMYEYPLHLLLAPLFAMFVYQQYDKFLHPTDYVFLPYCKGTYDFSAGRYHVKTDSENADIANVVAAILVTIVVVAAVIFIGVSVTHIIKAARAARVASQIGVLDNAMWNGAKLNLRGALKYSRLQKRQDRLSAGTEGLAGAASRISAVSNAVSSVRDMVSGERSNDVSGPIVTDAGVDTANVLMRIKALINNADPIV